jgi:ZIP family zinc transporter
MLSVVCFDLIAEAIKPEINTGDTNIFLVALGTSLGYLVTYLLNDIIDQAAGSGVRRKYVRSELFIAGVVMAFAIALHNLPEGMVIGAAYASDTGHAERYTGSSLLLAVDIPEGLAVAVPLIGGGMRRAKAVLLTALSGVPTVAGALLGYFVGMMSPFALSMALSFASGAMLYVVFGELLPEAILIWHSKKPAFAVLTGILLGMIIIFAG